MSLDHVELRYDLLPKDVEVTAQGIETGAIHEVHMGKYTISAFDPALQTPEVQEQYAMFSPLNMAALTLQAAGVDWKTTKAVLEPAVGEELGGFDERLSNPYYAIWAVGSCFRAGLLRAEQTSPTSRADVLLSQRERQTLNGMSHGQIGRNDVAARQTLAELLQRYPKEPSLLPFITKAAAIGALNVSPNPEVRHARDFIPYEEGDDIWLDHMRLRLRQDDLESRKRRSNIDESRRLFIARLKDVGIDPKQLGERTIARNGTTFTFDFPRLTPKQNFYMTLYVLGCSAKEATYLAGKDYESENNINMTRRYLEQAKEKLRIPEGVDPTLFCISKGHVRFDKPMAISEAGVPAENVKLLRYRVINNTPLEAFGSDVHFWEGAMLYTYDALEVTTRREAILAAATHGLLPLPPEQRIGRPTQPDKKQTYAAQEASFEKNLHKQLEIGPNYTEFTVNWRGAEIKFDFRGELVGYDAAVLIGRSFGLNNPRVNAFLPKDMELKDISARLEAHFGTKDPAAQMLEMFHRGYVSAVNTEKYRQPRITTTEDQKVLIGLLDTYTPKELPKRLWKSPSAYHGAAHRIYEKYKVPDHFRLVWAAALRGELSALRDQVAKTKPNTPTDHPHIIDGDDAEVWS